MNLITAPDWLRLNARQSIMIEKLADTQHPIHEVLARRWSGRAFETTPLTREQIVTLMEAARWAPSCFNDQPWCYLVWDKSSDPGSWQKAFACLGEGNQSWVIDAPLLLAACADSEFTKKPGKPNRWGQHDTGAASTCLCIQASAMGLMAHQMGGFDSEKLRAAFNIPQRYTPMAMITVGHPVASAEQLDQDRKARELAPRERYPLDEKFFEATWGTPLKQD
ncbi:MAG: nitroreductase family protein [Acidiferrobacterales bacterium]